MTTITSAPRKEITAKRSVRPIGGIPGEMDEMDNFGAPERPFKPFGLPAKGSLHFRIPPVEITQKALDLSGKTTKVGLSFAKGLGEGFLDVFKMIKGNESEPKTPEAKAKEQKTQEAETQNRFVHQKTTGIEQAISNEAKRRMQEAAVSFVGQNYSNRDTGSPASETFKIGTASRVFSEKKAKLERMKKRNSQRYISSPAKKEGSRGPKRSTDNTAMQEGNSAVGGSGGDNTA